MKRLFYILIGCMFVACNGTYEDVHPEKSAPRFYAIIDDGSSRTYIDENANLFWTEEDLVSVFYKDTYNRKYMFDGDTGDNYGDFYEVDESDGFTAGFDLNRNYAIYPYNRSNKVDQSGWIRYTFPTEQTYVENSFGLGANPMVAVTESIDDKKLRFRNASGYIRVYLYGNNTVVKSVKLEGNNSEPLAGKSKITPVYGGEPTIEMYDNATTSVTIVSPPNGVTIGSTPETATPFWFVIPPTDFSQGLTITVNGFYGGSITKSFNSQINIKRNKYKSTWIDATITPTDGANLGVVSWGDGKKTGGTAE